jgi:hypothetical protein
VAFCPFFTSLPFSILFPSTPDTFRLLGLDLDSGALRLSVALPPAHPPAGASRPYDLRDGVAYVDACRQGGEGRRGRHARARGA